MERPNTKTLAASCGVTTRAIDYVLSGQRRPSPGLALKLEKATKVPRLAWLYPAEYYNKYLPDKYLGKAAITG